MEETTRKAVEEKVARRYKDSLLQLEELIKNARFSNDKISQQLFVLNDRALNLAENIGFSSFDDLEEAVLDEPDIWKVDIIRGNHAKAMEESKRLQARERHPRDASASNGFKEEFDQLKRQVLLLERRYDMNPQDIRTTELSEVSANTRSPLAPLTSVGNSSSSEEAKLRAELRILSRKYDALVAAKEASEKKYKEDHQKWRRIKTWLFNKSKHARTLRAQLAKENLDFDIDLQDITTDSSRKASPVSSRGRSSPDPINEPETRFTFSSPTKPVAVTPKTGRHSPKRPASGSSDLIQSENHFPKTDTVASKGRKRKEFRDQPNDYAQQLDLAESTSIIKSETSEVLHGSAKGKGRYAGVTAAGATINALYTVDTSKNNGLPFQFDEVVRGKEHRQRLEAGDCDCCKEYYDLVGPLPERLAPPAWDSTSAPDVSSATHQHQKHVRSDITERHKKEISRHRHQWSPTETPPDYWNIGFPTTQEAADINRRAAEMHADKRRRVEKEANTIGGRYIRR